MPTVAETFEGDLSNIADVRHLRDIIPDRFGAAWLPGLGPLQFRWSSSADNTLFLGTEAFLIVEAMYGPDEEAEGQ